MELGPMLPCQPEQSNHVHMCLSLDPLRQVDDCFELRARTLTTQGKWSEFNEEELILSVLTSSNSVLLSAPPLQHVEQSCGFRSEVARGPVSMIWLGCTFPSLGSEADRRLAWGVAVAGTCAACT